MHLSACPEMKTVGRLKAPPSSPFEPSECTTSDELSKSCFTRAPTAPVISPSFVEVSSAISSESSVMTSSSGYRSVQDEKRKLFGSDFSAKKDVDIVKQHTVDPAAPGAMGMKGHNPFYVTSYKLNGERMLIPVSDSSRQGRANQRWLFCPKSNRVIRPVSGCIPITKDGKIIFISSSKKKEWILPKGGWELDESLEETALRETYEEAGILGKLGAKLFEKCYETRKGKKRRLEKLGSSVITREIENVVPPIIPDEEIKNNKEQDSGIVKDELVHRPHTLPHIDNSRVSPQPQFNCTSSLLEIPMPYLSLSPDKSNDDPGALYGSGAMSRMTFFPLYVTEVLKKWPECGRARKILTIDEALSVVNREELRAVLLEVKQKCLVKANVDGMNDIIETVSS